MGLGKAVYKLFVINTLDSIVKIDTLIEGLIVSTFGVLFGFFGYYGFKFLNLGFSAEIAWLSFYAYLAVLLYHYVKYERDKPRLKGKLGKHVEGLVEIVLTIIGILIMYSLILDQAILVTRLFTHSTYGAGMLFLLALPGLAVLAIPLVAWEKLCKYTPVDEIVKKVFK